jgi:hypothetical protein
LTDIFAIQDEISRGIVNSLRLKLGRGRRRYETSAEAYDLYLRARAIPIQTSLTGYDETIGPLEEVVAKDPSFAPAFAGLAAVYAARAGVFGFDRPEELTKMRATAEKAVYLDPLLAEAHDGQGMAYAARRPVGTGREELPARDRARPQPLDIVRSFRILPFLPSGLDRRGASTIARRRENRPALTGGSL